MAARKAEAFFRNRALRFVHFHLRLFVAAAVGAVAWPLLRQGLPFSTSVLASWNVGVGLYLILTAVMMAREDVDAIRARAGAQDEGAGFILVLTAVAALASVAAIFAELAGAESGSGSETLRLALAVATIILSWLFTYTIFALHYAYEYYGEGRRRGGGMKFPGHEAPDYSDFIYFSLVIGMTSQVSDVVLTKRSVRRTVSAHGVFSFIYNTTIIALTVSIASGVIKGE